MKLSDSLLTDEKISKLDSGPNGFILPEGFFVLTDSMDTHLAALQRMKTDMMSFFKQHGGIRKRKDSYQFHYQNKLAKSLIEADLKKTPRPEDELIFISMIDSRGGEEVLSLTYGEFISNGSVLPNPELNNRFFRE